MRFNLFLLLMFLCGAATAQQTPAAAKTPAGPSLGLTSTSGYAATPGLGGTPAATATTKPSPAANVSGSTAGNGAPGIGTTTPPAQSGAQQAVIPLGEATKAPAEEKPQQKVGEIKPVSHAITIVDGNGKAVDDAAAKLSKPPKIPDISLTRISRKGNDVTATLLVHGAGRRVKVGDTVLKMTVTAIREDGVCLDAVPSVSKCARRVTFVTGADSEGKN
ncbi:MAG TPA: hypothetical protein VEC35_09490 [Noviherbaspirillum sp.]|nr:hypothetical protein [Noviherbaspirillum sp.]